MKVVMLGMLLIATYLTASGKPIDAEYAIRWNANAAGPESIEETAKVLKLKVTQPSVIRVQYYEVTKMLIDAPSDFTAILRERIPANKKSEVAFKYRRSLTPFPVADMPKWKCPLPTAAKSKQEVDVSITSTAAVRATSLSCKTKAKFDFEAFKTTVGATPRKCVHEVLSSETADGVISIESWPISDEVTVVEVSMKGKDTVGDMDAFNKRVVARLMSKGIATLDKSMTELTAVCVPSK